MATGRATGRPKSRATGRTTGGPRLLGAHQSIAGGFPKAVERATATGCTCLQIFTRNVNRWDAAPIPPAAAAEFRAAVRAAGLGLVVAHDSYLINPAAADPVLRRRSIDGLVLELERAEQLGLPWVVAHPGAAGERPVDEAVRAAADGIAEALDRTRGLRAGILVETTAGQGSCLGARFEEIGDILAVVDADRGRRKRIGVCLDTCHVFAAGYPLYPRAALDDTLAAFDRHVGLRRLALIHVNDSKRDRGSRVDRHEELGPDRDASRAGRHPADPRDPQGGTGREARAGERHPQPRPAPPLPGGAATGSRWLPAARRRQPPVNCTRCRWLCARAATRSAAVPS
jgi:deoxyribonuclease-4